MYVNETNRLLRTACREQKLDASEIRNPVIWFRGQRCHANIV